jgi:hypothetical protein
MARKFIRASSQYLDLTAAPIGGVPLTMACWFNLSDITNGQFLMSISDYSIPASGDYFALVADGTAGGDPLNASTYQSSTKSATTSSGYSAGTWHHGCAVFAAVDDRRAYIDGGSKGTNAESMTPADLSHTGIGTLIRQDWPATFTDGLIAEAVWWNAALTDDEVAILAKRYSPLFVRPQNIVQYLPLIRDNDEDIVGGYSWNNATSPTVDAHPPIIYPGMMSPLITVSTASGSPFGPPIQVY